MDKEQTPPAGVSVEHLTELFGRYLRHSLEEHEYPILADAMWGESDPLDRAFMQRVLSEPPIPGSVFAPQELLVVLMLEAQSQNALEPTQMGMAREHLRQVRMAICYCLNETVSRRTRLATAFNQLAEASFDPSLPTSTTHLMWLAELAYRLSDELAGQEDADYRNLLADVGREAALGLAPFCRSISEFHALLRQFCDLTLRLEAPLRGSAEGDAWEGGVQRALDCFRIGVANARTVEHTANDEDGAAEEAMENILPLVRAAVFQSSEVLSEWLELYRETPITASGFLDKDDGVQELFQTLLVIARAHVARDRAVDPSLRAVLCVLREMELRRRVTYAHLRQFDQIETIRMMQETLELLAKGERTAEEQRRLEELEAKADARRPPELVVDPATLSGAIDDLLVPYTRRGLALSGGGFRAACFHLGVLAALADRDLLRRVDMLSCVSGGAIAGAAYAVRLKALHTTKHDLEITVDDYRTLVADLVDVFIRVTGMNLRAAAFRSPRAIWRMWSSPNYTFSERIADLLDDHLFAPLVRSNPKYRGVDEAKLKALRVAGLNYSQPTGLAFRENLGKSETIWPLTPWDLMQAPLGEPARFEVDSKRNGARRSKCPELFINTTALNTGGGYIFSTSGNGEPVNELRREISSRPTLRWRRYGDISAGGDMRPESFRISRIVAASASVPGLLAPILFRRTGQEALLALADGGVCDNQGFNPLFSNGCNWILASDAAGQLKFQAFPEVANIEVMTHSTDVLMERIREQSYSMAHRLAAAQPTIKFTALHLTRGLTDPSPHGAFDLDERLADLTRSLRRTTEFGVDSECQRLLASMRTDLDCYSEAEALSLMADGYLQASHSLDDGANPSAEPAQNWRFGKLIPKLEKFEQDGDLATVLGAARYRAMRLPRLVAAKLGFGAAGQRFVLATLYLAALVLAGTAAFVGPASGATGHVLRWLLLYLLAVFLVHKLPPTSFKRWLWKLASGPFLLAAMLHSWAVIYACDPLYRRLCRLK
ncbi:patatin-like phospholipase family protein [Roseateles chitinivorans]|uniref:patatin-like phospholipase family protein n=1 Tax=Roseateles chitinivorans TaxID=2917965 RepID=UPI003D66BD33